jgi:hypothetical protein
VQKASWGWRLFVFKMQKCGCISVLRQIYWRHGWYKHGPVYCLLCYGWTKLIINLLYSLQSILIDFTLSRFVCI